MKRTASPRPSLWIWALRFATFLAVAGKRQRDRLAVGAKPRHRIHQQVGALDVPEFPDIDEVGGVAGLDDRVELRRGHAIEDAADKAAGVPIMR